MALNWELALMIVIERELAQLQWLVECVLNGTDDIGKTDVHGQISRISGLTDLAKPDGLPLSEISIAKLRQLNDAAMLLARNMAFGG